MEYSGVVKNVSSREFNGNNLYSFTLNNVRSFFRTGTTPPGVEAGQFVTFTGLPDPKGNVNVDRGSINAREASTKEAASSLKSFRSSVPSGSKEMTSTGYWEAKEKRDISTQKRIEIQSVRNSALTFIDLLLKSESFKLPAKNRVEAMEELLEHYMSEFLIRNGGAAKAPEQVPVAEVEEESN